MTQLDLNRVRQSIKNQIGSKIKISANRGRHKFVTAKGVNAHRHTLISFW